MKGPKFWKGLVLSVCVVFAAAACGDDDPSKDTNSTTVNNTTANNTTVNNTTANNTSANNDLCANVDCAIGLPAPTCDGDVAVTSASTGCDPATGMCGYDEDREDCAANGEVCMNGACVADDLCATVECTPADAPSCDGDTAVVPMTPTCNPANGMCEADADMRTDCTTTDQICVDGACVDDTGPCAGVMCPQPADGCQMQELVVYSGAGVCDMATGECDYSAAETRTDCTANGEICLNGACAADNDATVNAGDLVITEFMQNPSAVADSVGEWFEIYNTTPRTLDIEGLILDDGGNQVVIAGTNGTFPVPGFSYLLVAKGDDNTVNGGLPAVDVIFADMSLANGSDTITIYAANGTDVIDQVAYDNGATFPDGNGSSAQFGAEYDLATDDNNDGQFWCENIFTTYGDGDFGTPKAANDFCRPPAVASTIYDVQDENAANHPAVGTNVTVTDVIVTATNGADVLFVQESAGGQFSGIAVDASGVDTSTLNVGDVVDVEGIYVEGTGFADDGRSYLAAFAVTSKNMTANVTAEVVSSADLSTDAGAEPWEGVLIQVLEPAVTDAEPDGTSDFGEFRIDAAIRVDDELYDYDATADPLNCWTFDQITGPLQRSFGNFKVIPRDANDFVTANTTLTTSGATGASNVGDGGLAFSPEDICVDAGATVTWTWSSGVHDVESRDAGASTPAATKVLDSADLTMAGDTFEFTFADAGNYHYLCSYHPGAMQGQVIVLE